MIFFAGRISKKSKDGFYAYLILGKTFFCEKKLNIMELKAVFKIFQLRPGTIKNLHLGSLYRLESPKNQNSKVGRKSGFGSKGLKKKKNGPKRVISRAFAPGRKIFFFVKKIFS